jgi:hypothetical protein
MNEMEENEDLEVKKDEKRLFRELWIGIAKEYMEGASLYMLTKKYRLNPFAIKDMLQDLGVRIREPEETLQMRAWHLLRPVNWLGGRTVYLPGEILRAMGYRPNAILKGRWLVLDNRLLMFEIKEDKNKEVK